jgi:hypothetical protein
MSEQKAVMDELENLSTRLADFKSGTRVDDPTAQYFLKMQADVLRRIQQEGCIVSSVQTAPKKSKRIPAWVLTLPGWVWRPAIALAAGIMGVWMLQTNVQEKNPEKFSQLTMEEALNYMADHAEHFYPEALIGVMPGNYVWVEPFSGIDEASQDALLDAMLETLETEELETLY